MALKKGIVGESKKEELPFNEDSTPTAKKDHSEDQDVTELTDAQLAVKMIKDLQAEVDALKSRPAPSDEYDDQSIIDDWLETPVIFFCFSDSYSNHSEKRRGKDSFPPNGPIKFKPLHRYKRRHGQDWKVISTSQCVTHSSNEVEWLRNSPGYGIKFFENENDAKNVNASLAQKMLTQHGIVSRMSDHAVIERARIEGLAVKSGDLAQLRRSLVETLAEKAMKADKKVLESIATRNAPDNPEIRNIPSSVKAQAASPQKEVY
ncbi:MAG: hypothetical protein ACXAB7_09960 [Candidatus Kariarchaeaceae archaeon]|jgi:hypothetical protein